jgi:hypothetical protein
MIVLCFIAGIITGLVLAHRNHRRVALAAAEAGAADLQCHRLWSTANKRTRVDLRLSQQSTPLTGICLWVVCLQERSKPVCRLLSPDDAFDAPVGYEPDDGD